MNAELVKDYGAPAYAIYEVMENGNFHALKTLPVAFPVVWSRLWRRSGVGCWNVVTKNTPCTDPQIGYNENERSNYLTQQGAKL